jgi:hypothetical protein
MNNYQSSTPRVALGIAAAAMTAVTFGVFIVMPAMIESAGEGVRTQAVAKVVIPDATEVAIIPGRIEVLGVRETGLASAPSTTLTLVKAADADRADLPRVHRVSACVNTRDRPVIQMPGPQYRPEGWSCGSTEDFGH